MPTIFFANTRDGLELSLTQPEPDFRLIRSEGPGRTLGYTMEPVTSNGAHP